MAYSEELDIIQNMKNLSAEISNALKNLSEVQPSLDEMRDLKSKFEQLESNTLKVINDYDITLNDKSAELEDLITNARSQFKQVTDDVESLVNLEVDFNDIKSKILECLDINNNLADIVGGTTVMMTSDNIVTVGDRKPYKKYYEVI